MPVFRLPPYRIVTTQMALAESIPWGLRATHIPEHWKNTKGKGIKIGIADTGYDFHPDLAGAVLEQRDFSGSQYGAKDRQGHGTHVAGTIAARQNDLGVVGVAPEAELIIAKVLGDDGSGSGDSVAAGIDWLRSRGVKIISMSLGSPYEDPHIRDAINRAYDAGIYVICAAGNDGQDNSVNYPARWPTTVAVAAFDEQGRVAKFSSRGPEVDIAGPGVNVPSTYLRGGYATLSGTSMATPFVTGVVALLLARNPVARTPVNTPKQLLEHLSRTAIDIGPDGHDTAAGWGLINPDKLLASDCAPEVPTPTPQPTPEPPTQDGLTLIVMGQEVTASQPPPAGCQPIKVFLPGAKRLPYQA